MTQEPAGQTGCAGRNEALCGAPCIKIKSRAPTSEELEFMECVASELGAGTTVDSCGLSPDQSECRIFPTTRLAIGWRETPCNHPVCTGVDASLDADIDASLDADIDATLPTVDASTPPDSAPVADADG